jgi:predicted metal-binding protein
MKVCRICKREFKEKSYGDLYCGVLCLNASITDKEQEQAILTLDDKGIKCCPICGRNKSFLIHKRMNGCWYLWQEYHYNNNSNSIYTCYYCNLWEMNYRRRTGKKITPLEHRELIGVKNV